MLTERNGVKVFVEATKSSGLTISANAVESIPGLGDNRAARKRVGSQKIR